MNAKEWVDKTKGYVDLVISLSTGALALSITFVSQLEAFNFPRLILGVCWIGFVVSIIMGLHLHRLLLDVNEYTMKNESKEAMIQNQEIDKVYFWQMAAFQVGFLSLAGGALWNYGDWYLPSLSIVIILIGLHCKYGKPFFPR